MLVKIRQNHNRIPFILFYLGLTIELIVVIIDRSALPPMPEGHIYRVTFLLFALKICFTKYTKKEWMWIILFAAFTAGMYFMTGQNMALRAVFFVVAMRDISIKEAMRYAFGLMFSGFLLIIGLAFLGIGRDIKSTEVFREVVETRYHFGIGHPNTFYCMIFILLLLFFYCYQEKIKLYVLASLFIVTFGLFILTDSRTGFIVTFLLISGVTIFYLLPKMQISKWVYYSGIFAFLFCIGISVWAAANSIYAWENPMIAQIDRLLSGRMKVLYWGNAFHAGILETWTLFSSADHFEAWHMFDMGWVRMFYWFGIIPGIAFTGLHLLLLNECRKQNDYMGLLLVTAAAIYTIVEPQFISPYLGRNVLLFLFGLYWGRMLSAEGNEDFYWWGMIKDLRVRF